LKSKSGDGMNTTQSKTYWILATLAVGTFALAGCDMGMEADEEEGVVFAVQDSVRRPLTEGGEQGSDSIALPVERPEATVNPMQPAAAWTAPAAQSSDSMPVFADQTNLGLADKHVGPTDHALGSGTCQNQFGSAAVCNWDSASCTVRDAGAQGSCSDYCRSNGGTCLSAMQVESAGCGGPLGGGLCEEPASDQVCVCHKETDYEFKTCDVAVRWGQAYTNLDSSSTTTWDGSLFVESGKVMLVETLDWEMGGEYGEGEDDHVHTQWDARLQEFRSSTRTYNDGLYLRVFVPTGHGAISLLVETEQMQFEAELSVTSDINYIKELEDNNFFGIHLTCL
jgi:hypothetical protein